MSDVIIEFKDTIEFAYDGFRILYEDDVWYVDFEDPDTDLIIIEDLEGKYFEKELLIGSYLFTNKEFEELKRAIQ